MSGFLATLKARTVDSLLYCFSYRVNHRRYYLVLLADKHKEGQLRRALLTRQPALNFHAFGTVLARGEGALSTAVCARLKLQHGIELQPES